VPEGTRPAPPDDTVRVVFLGTQSGFSFALIMWLQLTASARNATDLAAILTTINTAWGAQWKPLQPGTCVLNSIQGIWKTPGGGEIVATNGTTQTGSSGDTVVMNIATAPVVNWHIDQYYRGGKPRSYMPAPRSSHVTDAVHLTAAGLTAYGSAAAAFLTAVNAAASGSISATRLGTVSFARANAWRVPPVFYPYTSASIRSTLGIQRRRLLA